MFLFKNESNWRMASNRDILNNLSLHGDKDATIVSIECPQEHSMNAIIVTRESVARLCGFGVTLSSRYLDDQVQLCATITYCNNSQAKSDNSQAKSDSQDHILSCKQELICSTFATVKQQRNEFKSERDSIVEKLTILTAQIQQCRSKVALQAAKTHKLCKKYN